MGASDAWLGRFWIGSTLSFGWRYLTVVGRKSGFGGLSSWMRRIRPNPQSWTSVGRQAFTDSIGVLSLKLTCFSG